jgi:selenoprotein W-related protein
LIRQFEAEIESLSLVPSAGGRFEVTVNGQLLYSKLATQRHAEKGELAKIIQKYVREGNL